MLHHLCSMLVPPTFHIGFVWRALDSKKQLYPFFSYKQVAHLLMICSIISVPCLSRLNL
uniref:Uncharacterized protein n=1 Tax=Oryza brachyantha TaxID=4533 RepID=J3MDC1_ORYBR